MQRSASSISDFQASVSMLNDNISNGTIRKELNVYGFFGRVEITGWHSLHLNKPAQPLRESPFAAETKAEIITIVHSAMFAAYQHKNIIPTIKHGSGGSMVWAILIYL